MFGLITGGQGECPRVAFSRNQPSGSFVYVSWQSTASAPRRDCFLYACFVPCAARVHVLRVELIMIVLFCHEHVACFLTNTEKVRGEEDNKLLAVNQCAEIGSLACVVVLGYPLAKGRRSIKR